jgi:hypothetical protein
VDIVSCTLAVSTTLVDLALVLHIREGVHVEDCGLLHVRNGESADSSLIHWRGRMRYGGIEPRLISMHHIRNSSNAIPRQSNNPRRIMGVESGGVGVVDGIRGGLMR